MGGIDALTELFSTYPANCPPTIVTLQAEPPLVETFIAKLDRDLNCSVVAARDGASLTPGTIHIAYAPDRHAVLEAGEPAKLRLIDREPVDGARPSATLMFGTIARAGLPAIGAVLTGMGKDGAKGLKLMRDVGCKTLAQDPATATVAEAPAEALDAGAAELSMPLDGLAGAILQASNQS